MTLQRIKNACDQSRKAYKEMPINATFQAPTLGVITTNDTRWNNAGPISVNYMIKCAKEAGFNVLTASFNDDQTDIAALLVDQWNADPAIDGIVVDECLGCVHAAIEPEKDVAAYHPDSEFDQPHAKALMYLLHSLNEDLEDLHAVVVQDKDEERLDVLRRLLDAGCTVSQVDPLDKHFRDMVALGDIVVVNAQGDKLVDSSMLKPDAIVIDLGWHLHSNEPGAEFDPAFYPGSIDKESIMQMDQVTYSAPMRSSSLIEAVVLENVLENYRITR